jgi:hypothetical protein
MTKKKKKNLNSQDLADLARLAQAPEIKVLWRLMENSVIRDKNSIITYPETDPVKLAIEKSFYRGRISAIHLIKKEIMNAGRKLDKLEEAASKPVKKSK